MKGGSPMTNPNTDARRLTLAKSYEEEADDIMMWAEWYKRHHFYVQYEKQVKMAQDRYDHAKKLRGSEE